MGGGDEVGVDGEKWRVWSYTELVNMKIVDVLAAKGEIFVKGIVCRGGQWEHQRLTLERVHCVYLEDSEGYTDVIVTSHVTISKKIKYVSLSKTYSNI